MEANETGKAKRRRIALACTQCRSRKTKCDGAQPICSSCASNGFLCIYDVGNNGITPLMIRNEDFQALAQRVSSLESELERLKRAKSIQTGDVQNQGPLSGHDSVRNALNVSPGEASGSASTPGHLREREREGVDGMGIVYEIGQLPAHYGSSSTAYLTEALMAAVPQENNAHHQEPIPEPVSTSLDQLPPLFAQSIGKFPSFQDGKHFLHKFEVEIWPTYPIVPIQLLRDIYQSFQERSASTIGETQQLALLKSVFALSAAFCGAEADGAAYFQSAHQPSDGLDVMESGDSLWKVCSLIYSVLYLQSTDRPSPAWHTIGRAIRICLALGYHTERPHLRPIEEIHSEVACRAWHACLNIDRFVSMSLGRPSSIQVPCPLLRLPKPVQHEAPDQLQYLISCTLLSNILARLLTALYLENCTPLLSDQTRGSYEQDLLFWRHQLPPHLDLRQYPSIIAAPQNAVMLALRFHTTYMLLHRFSVQEVIRIIAQKGSTSSSDSLYTSPARLPYAIANSFSCCVSAAAETVDILSQVKNVSVAHKGGAAWYRLFFTYNAFTILVTAVLAVDADVYLPPGSLPRDDRVKNLALCEECERLIEELAKSYRSSRRCLGVVQQLLARVKRSAHGQVSVSASMPSTAYDFDFNRTLEDIKNWIESDTHGAGGLISAGQSHDHTAELDDAFDVFSGDLAWLAQQ